MATSTDQEILNLLIKGTPLSILEIASLLNLTKADIRYHINKLLLQNKIIKISPNQGVPGRPAFRYAISDDEYKNNLEFLTNGLLSLFPDRSELISKLSDYFTSDLSLDSHQPIIIKLNSLISDLAHMHYSPRWETQFQGPMIYFGNCPYRKLLESHPDLCEMDKMIISKHLIQDVEVKNTIANGSHFCKFLILIKNPARNQ
jgi:predicted ArsR family transcriptional regulator